MLRGKKKGASGALRKEQKKSQTVGKGETATGAPRKRPEKETGVRLIDRQTNKGGGGKKIADSEGNEWCDHGGKPGGKNPMLRAGASSNVGTRKPQEKKEIASRPSRALSGGKPGGRPFNKGAGRDRSLRKRAPLLLDPYKSRNDTLYPLRAMAVRGWTGSVRRSNVN